MKHTFFTPDKKYAVQFFNDPRDGMNPNVQDRIRTIVGIYNPTVPEENGGAIGNSRKTAEYFRNRFCWPVAIVRAPEFGIVCPAYPQRFFFGENASTAGLNLKGKDKKSNWFTGRMRKYISPGELGDFRTMLSAAICLSRSVRRMHQAGLAHSDLSCNNVLIDPQTGSTVVIDIDSLVVPGKYPRKCAAQRATSPRKSSRPWNSTPGTRGAACRAFQPTCTRCRCLFMNTCSCGTRLQGLKYTARLRLRRTTSSAWGRWLHLLKIPMTGAIVPRTLT